VEGDKPHISPSQVASYTRCGEAYRRRYIEHEIIPPTIALHKGSAIHKGANFNFSQKIKSRVDLKPKEVVDFSVASFESSIKEKDLTLSSEDGSKSKVDIVAQAKDRTAQVAGILIKDSAPKFQPKSTEEEVYITLPSSSHNLKGFIDLETEDERIVDYKTSSRATWNQEKTDRDFQLTFYAMAYRSKNGKDPKEVAVENLIDGGKQVRVAPFVSRRGWNDYDAAIKRLNAVLNGINAGVYSPAHDGAWWCAPAYCGYWHSCPYVKK